MNEIQNTYTEQQLSAASPSGKETKGTKTAWVVTATMGYGHQRAVYPLRNIAEEGIVTVGTGSATTKQEAKLWNRLLAAYEFISRTKSVPLIGNVLFNLLDALLHIPAYYPVRDLSAATFQVNMLYSSISKGLCSAMVEKVSSKNLPLITSYFASAIAADVAGIEQVYCIICDADLNRVWVAKAPWESRIIYFSPCGKATQRLKSYGVPDERILTTGFPLPDELVGGTSMQTLKQNLLERLAVIDPRRKFLERNGQSVAHFLDEEPPRHPRRKFTISFVIGGAGAQKEIGTRIAFSLKDKIRTGEVKLNLIAGTKPEVRDYFAKSTAEISTNPDEIDIIFAQEQPAYFELFTRTMATTDVLWTKPSELSFYCALGIPIIIAPPIGAQERFNSRWLREIQAGFKQLNPDYTHQWLFELLKKGLLADMAWAGFLKVRKLGTYKIMSLLETGKLEKDSSSVLR